MTLKLKPLFQEDGSTLVLQRPIYLIGRDAECDFRLPFSKISRVHCCLATAYDRVLIRDLGSRNGIRVNGRSVMESQLFRGDEIAIGPLIFRLESEIDPANAAAPPGALKDRDDRGSEPEIELVPLDDV